MTLRKLKIVTIHFTSNNLGKQHVSQVNLLISVHCTRSLGNEVCINKMDKYMSQKEPHLETTW